MNPNQVKIGLELKNAEESIEVSSIPETAHETDGRDNLFDDEQPSCRLCFGTALDDSDLIEPCLCKGTIAKVHRKCLEKWLNIRQSTKCDLCQFQLQCDQKLRYGLFESIGIWFRLHQHQQLLLNDLGLFFIINTILLSMIIMLLRSLFNLSTNESLSLWYFILLDAVLLIWIGIYSTVFFIVANTQFRPWYRWWKSKKQIQLAVN